MWDTVFSFAMSWKARVYLTILDLRRDCRHWTHMVLRCQPHAAQLKRPCLVSPLWTLNSFPICIRWEHSTYDQFERGRYSIRLMLFYNQVKMIQHKTREMEVWTIMFGKATAQDMYLCSICDRWIWPWQTYVTVSQTTCYYFWLLLWHGNIRRDNRF